MHNFQVTSHKDPAWVPLPYMVTDEDIDRLIATWPPQWKIGFKSGVMGIAGASAPKVNPTTTKEQGGSSKGSDKAGNVGSPNGAQPKPTTPKDG